MSDFSRRTNLWSDSFLGSLCDRQLVILLRWGEENLRIYGHSCGGGRLHLMRGRIHVASLIKQIVFHSSCGFRATVSNSVFFAN